MRDYLTRLARQVRCSADRVPAGVIGISEDGGQRLWEREGAKAQEAKGLLEVGGSSNGGGKGRVEQSDSQGPEQLQHAFDKRRIWRTESLGDEGKP